MARGRQRLGASAKRLASSGPSLRALRPRIERLHMCRPASAHAQDPLRAPVPHGDARSASCVRLKTGMGSLRRVQVTLHIVRMPREARHAPADSTTRPSDDSAERPRSRDEDVELRLMWCFGPEDLRRVGVPLKTSLRVGRAAVDDVAALELRIADPDLSREHFEIARSRVGWTLVDTSRNGTYVDGQRAPAHRAVLIQPNTVIRAGHCLFVLSRTPRALYARGDAPVGRSAWAEELRSHVARVAPLDVPVLILGETGAGKEYVARALHTQSGRPRHAFVWVNSSEIDQSIGRAELFGARKGAYTDAAGHPGLIAAAEGGTLFLDEIGNLSLDMQGKMLRFLDDRRYRSVGGDEVTSSARVVAATNRDLEKAVGEGTFREDFLARLRSAMPPIELPPLRERREDLLDWCDLYFAREGQRLGASAFRCTAGFAETVLLHPWPRNLRALHEGLGAAVLRAKGPVLAADDLPHEVQATRTRARSADEVPNPVLPVRDGQAVTREALHAALAACKGNLRRAAVQLGMDRTKVYREAKRLGVDVGAYRDVNPRQEGGADE